ncbi:unnamed protein product [Brassica rapa]|uniref:Methyltransferase type 11 domain-containing protein n=1 Tax=Brassica campestris TaxID=3711 RepID=A0A3P6B9A0_BRACM|nr:unnamed protein product [Brassica rapa]VDD01693.1 unnamed protein product [Brassica rapa]
MAILNFTPASRFPVNIDSARRTRVRGSVIKMQKSLITTDPHPPASPGFSLCTCGRKHFLGEATTPFLPISPSYAAPSTAPPTAPNSTEVLNQLRPPKPDWYFELYGYFRSAGMERYEKEIAVYKRKLFANLVGKAETVLEIGIGAGPNIKYYNNIPNVSVLGVDPNPKMESHARKSAIEAGVKSENFKFIHAVAESMPLEDASVDAVVGSLVMCSVSDIPQTLKEIKRILKPGGLYLFVEHVAAEVDGTFLRMVQNVLDPLQQVVADGCHLTRSTEDYLLEAGFKGGVDINKVSLSAFYHLSPHLYGVAYN